MTESRQRHVASRRHVRQAKRFPAGGDPTEHVASRARTLPEDRSGEDTRRREETWACDTLPEDRSGEDMWRREDTWASEKSESKRRHVLKTGPAKTRGVAKERGQAKTLLEDSSGETTWHREGTPDTPWHSSIGFFKERTPATQPTIGTASKQ